jgi:hypothetical protein
MVLLAASILFGGVYVVPQGYDNMVSSANSKGFAILTQTVAQLSGNSYTIGGLAGVRYRCVPIPKIQCTAATPEINANISESVLKRPSTGELLLTFQTDMRIEDDVAGNRWLVCGAGYGGQVWDDSVMTSTTIAGNTTINYSYTPNANTEEYRYFTNIANASTTSYMTFTYEQVCR